MARLSLSLLGPLQITLGDRAVTAFRYDKVRALLVYLAVEADRPHRRDALTGLLWPELPQPTARNNLRQALNTLREAIGDKAAEPPFLIVTRESIQLHPAADVWLDVGEFTTLLDLCETHAHRRPESCKACAQRREAAVALYRGGFLEQFFLPDSAAFEEWALLKREWLQRMAAEALARLGRYHEARGEYEPALGYVRRHLELEPWREEAHRELMRLLVLNEERSAALVQYEECRRLLDEELGVEPEAETTRLYEQIRDATDESPLGLERLALPAERPHTLPPQPTPFVGREEELAEIARLLDDPGCRLLTLTGPGGIGKTRLAIQAASEQIDEFADGVYFVALAGLDSADLLITAIGAAIKYAFSPQGDPKRQLLAHLREKEMLLVLDNFEHLLDGVGLLAEILAAAPEVSVVVTSRERLNLHGEWVFELRGLAAPETEETEAVESYSAIQLFAQSARRVDRTFVVGEAERPSVVSICRLLEGLPLGIELAAGWVRLLSCREIAAEIERDMGFLSTALWDLPARHRSLRAVFEHSWKLLSKEEQRVFSKLAVFRGGFLREAGERLATTTLLTLSALLDKSLLRRTATGRYELHELVRQFALEKLADAGELETTRNTHLALFLELAERAESAFNGPEQARWLNRLEAESDNVRAALEWALGGEEIEVGLRLVAALYRFWYWRGHLSEGRRWLEAALEVAARRAVPPSAALRARVMHAAGVLADEQGDRDRAVAHYEASLALRREVGDKGGQAASLNSLGGIAWQRHDYERARALFEESLALRRELGQREWFAAPLSNLGLVALALGEYAQAEALFEESLAIDRELGDTMGIASDLCHLGTVTLDQGHCDRARALYGESLRLRQELGDKEGIAYCLEGFAGVAAAQADSEEEARRGRGSSARRRHFVKRSARPSFNRRCPGTNGWPRLYAPPSTRQPSRRPGRRGGR